MNRLMLTFIVIFLVFAGCNGGRETEVQLESVEGLMAEHPDSAVAVLLELDTAAMSETQRLRQELLYGYVHLIHGSFIRLDSANIARVDEMISGKFNRDEVKWLILKASKANQEGNPVERIGLLKDAEFLAVQIDDKFDLGIIYLQLANVYEQGFNGMVSKYYADKAAGIFRELNCPTLVRDARMAIVGAYSAGRDYKTMLDSLLAMQPEVMANASESYKRFFLEQLARSYDTDGQTERAITIWHSLYDGEEVTSNILAHWAHAYWRINELDSAYMLIQKANNLPHNNTDEYLCRNVEHDILEKMGRRHDLARIDSLREVAYGKILDDKKLEESSLALNVKYDSATRQAWVEASEARNRTNLAVLIAVLTVVTGVAVYIFLKKRNRLLRLEHENDLLKIRAMQDNLFEKDRINKVMSAGISELFHTRFNLLDGLAATYFECKDTGQEQKRLYSDVKAAISNFGSKEAIQELTDIVNGYNDNLMEKFRTDFPKLSASQYKLALYLFCGFSLPSISVFTNTELRNIYVYKSRLKSTISKSDSSLKAKYLEYFA